MTEISRNDPGRSEEEQRAANRAQMDQIFGVVDPQKMVNAIGMIRAAYYSDPFRSFRPSVLGKLQADLQRLGIKEEVTEDDVAVLRCSALVDSAKWDLVLAEWAKPLDEPSPISDFLRSFLPKGISLELVNAELEATYESFSRAVTIPGAFNWMGVLAGVKKDDPTRNYRLIYYLSERRGENITQEAQDGTLQAYVAFAEYAFCLEPAIIADMQLAPDNKITPEGLREMVHRIAERDGIKVVKEVDLRKKDK